MSIFPASVWHNLCLVTKWNAFPVRKGAESMSDPTIIREQVRQIRNLIQAGRERIAALRPVWGAYLARETMNNLDEAVGELEKTLGLEMSDREPDAGLSHTG